MREVRQEERETSAGSGLACGRLGPLRDPENSLRICRQTRGSWGLCPPLVGRVGRFLR